jgi:hypothetical protein
MAFKATPGDVHDVLLFMLLVQFFTAMTARTAPSSSSGGVTRRAFSIGIAVVHWEAVIEGSITPL